MNADPDSIVAGVRATTPRWGQCNYAAMQAGKSLRSSDDALSSPQVQRLEVIWSIPRDGKILGIVVINKGDLD